MEEDNNYIKESRKMEEDDNNCPSDNSDHDMEEF